MSMAVFPASIKSRLAFGQALRTRRIAGDGINPHCVEYCCAVTGYCRKQWYNWESGAMLPRFEALSAIKRLYPDLNVYLDTP